MCLLTQSMFFLVTLSSSNGMSLSVIQEKIDKATLSEVVKIPKGVFYGQLYIRKNVKLVGEGQDVTVLEARSPGNVIHIEGRDVKVHLEGFSMAGNWSPPQQNKKSIGVSPSITRGIYFKGKGHLQIKDVEIRGMYTSKSGAGIEIRGEGSGPKVLIQDSKIHKNRSDFLGGGVSMWKGGTLSIENSLISENGAEKGGGISFWGDALFLKKVRFDRNFAANNKGEKGRSLCNDEYPGHAYGILLMGEKSKRYLKSSVTLQQVDLQESSGNGIQGIAYVDALPFELNLVGMTLHKEGLQQIDNCRAEGKMTINHIASN